MPLSCRDSAQPAAQARAHPGRGTAGSVSLCGASAAGWGVSRAATAAGAGLGALPAGGSGLAGGAVEGVGELVEELDRQLLAFVGPRGAASGLGARRGSAGRAASPRR